MNEGDSRKKRAEDKEALGLRVHDTVGSGGPLSTEIRQPLSCLKGAATA